MLSVAKEKKKDATEGESNKLVDDFDDYEEFNIDIDCHRHISIY